MVLGISEDFTSDIPLDSELKALPTSGLYLNSGVHPSITVENLLDFLPNKAYTFAVWNSGTTYDKFLTSRNKKDIVTESSKTWQSIKASNTNQTPGSAPTFWVETDINSLRLKIFIESIKDRVYSDLSLTKRLVNNQYIYEDGDQSKTLLNDYAGWVIEPKGSDYVAFRINEMSLQKSGTTPVNLYVVNQKTLLQTITLTPSNGELKFEAVDIVLSGKGKFLLVIDSTDVFVGVATIDPLRFNGFVAYTAEGTGGAPETATYTYNTFGNGLGLNITAYLDATKYIDNNLAEFGNYIRAVFELMVFEVFLHNPNNRSNRVQRIQMNDDLLVAELKNMVGETIIRKYHRERKRAKSLLERTFDTQLNDHEGIEIRVGSV